MARETVWSASRIGCYKDCVLKFYYTYINKFVSNVPVNTVYADKGSVFHKTVEHWGEDITDKEELKKMLAHYCESYHIIDGDRSKLDKKDKNYDHTYNESRALEVFFTFWEKWVQPKLDDGYTAKQEIKYNPIINSNKFTGALDLLIEPSDPSKTIYVVDYKSGSDIHVDDYKLQQILYAYFLGLERGWDIAQTASKVKLYIFGPFAEKKRPITEEDKMLSCMKEIKYTEEEMQSIIDDYMSTITEIKTIEWDKVEPDNLGKYGKACTWCQYRGSNKNRAGFAGCKCTRDLGYKPEPGVSFDKPSSSKKKD